MLSWIYYEYLYFPFLRKKPYRKGRFNTMGLFKSLFGDASSRELKSIYPIVDKIEAMADEYKAMTDAQLQSKTV